MEEAASGWMQAEINQKRRITSSVIYIYIYIQDKICGQHFLEGISLRIFSHTITETDHL